MATDPQARFGAKGKNTLWYGYKEHISVDMQSGLINKVATTPANVPDAKGLRHICPDRGAVHGDKGYCTRPARHTMARKGRHDATIKTRNMKAKNRDKDRWWSGLRAPYERVFSKRPRRLRYRRQAKAQFQVVMHAMAHNLKRLVSLDIEKVAI